MVMSNNFPHDCRLVQVTLKLVLQALCNNAGNVSNYSYESDGKMYLDTDLYYYIICIYCSVAHSEVSRCIFFQQWHPQQPACWLTIGPPPLSKSSASTGDVR